MSSAKIEVEETNLEDLILLGEDKLINIIIEYPTENGSIKAKAKIKQLTMKELKGMDLSKADIQANIDILSKSLFQQDGKAFTKDLITSLPLGVVNAIAEKIMEVSGVNKDMDF